MKLLGGGETDWVGKDWDGLFFTLGKNGPVSQFILPPWTACPPGGKLSRDILPPTLVIFTPWGQAVQAGLSCPPPTQVKIYVCYFVIFLYHFNEFRSYTSLKWEIGACGVNIGKTLTSSWIKISRLSDFKLNYFANTTYFKLSECDDVSIVNIIQVKFSYFLCRIVLYA